MIISEDQFKEFAGTITPYSGLVDCMAKYEINTVQRVCHFLAQIKCESMGFTHLVENLNYSAEALLKTWPSHFTPELAAAYARNPEKIGNRAYANRMGNGDEASGDGYRYRGRSYIQTTGRINYHACGNSLGLDLINHPELLEQPGNAILAAGWFWHDRGLNAIADKAGDSVITVTRVVNGGLNGLKDRQDNYNKIKSILWKK